MNFILLGLFTICEAMLISYTTFYYNKQNILTAALLTLFLFIGLTTYACTTKKDFTYMGGILFALIFVLIGIGIIAMIFPIKLIQMIYCFGGLMLFSVYLIYDT